MEIATAEVYAHCSACGSNDWKIVRLIPKDLLDDMPLGKVPLRAKCARCGAIAGWLTIADPASLVN